MESIIFTEAVSLLFSEESDVKDVFTTSSSDDDSSEDEIGLMVQFLNTINQKKIIPRIKNYAEVTVPLYTAEQFKSHFRLYPETFEYILSLIGPKITKTKCNGGRKPIPAHKQLLLCLWTMATPDSYRSVCEKFNVGRATAIRAVRRVSYALHCLAPQFIQWPKNQRALEVMAEFERKSGFPQIIGAIDGTHIKIPPPKDDPASFINRKSYYSIQVQAVCDSKLLFTSVFAGSAGCVHDARVFRVSPVKIYLDRPEEYFQGDSHIIGDSAYGVHRHIMVPFKDNGHLNSRQKIFNYCLSSARMSIERAFGMWKGRWRSIRDCLPMTRYDKIPEYLVATMVLHNICILKHDTVSYEHILRIPSRGRLTNTQRYEGETKRLNIMNNLILRNT